MARTGADLWRPVSVKIVLALVMFATVPFLVYDQFRAANDQTNRLLVASSEVQGRLIAEALRPRLEKADREAMAALAEMVGRLGGVGPDIKLLFRPAAVPGANFFYVASAPRVSAAWLEGERREFDRLGVLSRLDATCAHAGTVGFRYTNPDGATELLTSLTAISTAAGCWVVITADHSSDALGTGLGQPYWRTAAVRGATLIYLAMAVAVLALLVQVWVGLRRFGRLARALRTGDAGRSGFAASNSIPELTWVAGEFDRLVDGLRASAEALRFAAEETAHAFKTPLGIIAQSLEPLRRRIGDDPRGLRSLELIDRSLERLDGLVTAARALDETLADTINPPLERVPLSDLVADLVAEYSEAHDPAAIRFAAGIDPGCVVTGASPLVEVVLQNLLDNAVSFSPAGGTIEVGLRVRPKVAELSVADQGPGVAPDTLERIFSRFVSLRESKGPPAPGQDGGMPVKSPAHFGLGLWIVRRNVEVMGGVVAAENRPDGGFRVVVALPLAEP
ncbi:MAG: sensor histidine kinase [Azospirillum sp.]|nr:sensor histidine kinase [Azospirillum sp.]